MNNEQLPQELSQLIQNIVERKDEKFSELVKISGLNPLEDFVDIDLSGEDLSNDDLGGINFSNADLSSVDLSRTNLRNANLRNINLRNANLAGASLKNANLRNANLRNTNLSATDLTGASLEGADLFGANLGLPEHHRQVTTSQNRRRQSHLEPSALYEQGAILQKSGQHEAALALYDKALKIQPNNYITWSQRGSVLAKMGRYSAALTSYNKALKLEENDYILWSKRGLALEALGRNQEALNSYKRASQLNPAYRAASYHRKRILAEDYTQMHKASKENRILQKILKLFNASKDDLSRQSALGAMQYS
jgi:tetratricopeptide (TPR) repeat protein